MALMMRKTANKTLLILYLVFTVTRKTARSNEMNTETEATIINKLILSIPYSYLFLVIVFLAFFIEISPCFEISYRMCKYKN